MTYPWRILLAGLAVVLFGGASSPGEWLREQQSVTVGGVAESWQLVWEGRPKPICGPQDVEMAITCPCTGFAYGEMGRAWHDIRFNADSAIKYYKSSIIITPGAFNSYSNLGLVYLRIGKLKLASYYFNKAFQINPNFTIARQRAEDIKRATGLDVFVYPLDEADGPQIGVGDGIGMPAPPIR